MLAIKLNDVLRTLRDRLSKIPGGRFAVVFGSVARGDFRPDSDVDVLFVVNDPEKVRSTVRNISSDIFSEMGVPITIIVVSLSDYLAERTSLIRRVKREGFLLWKA